MHGRVSTDHAPTPLGGMVDATPVGTIARAGDLAPRPGPSDSTAGLDPTTATVAAANLTSSMSRVANCWDNAVVESFFATLKTELPTAVFASHAAARSIVFDYIECFYHRQRRHSTLGYQTPLEAEAAYPPMCGMIACL